MSDHAAFLRAIIDDPDEDAHRLVYADWLDDHGEPDRAEFIRLQCRLARFCADDDPFTVGIPAEHLTPQRRRAWLGRLYDLGLCDKTQLPEPGYGSTAFPDDDRLRSAFLLRRGFVESVHLLDLRAWTAFSENAALLFDCAPLLHLRLWADSQDYYDIKSVNTLLHCLATLPEAARLRTLDARNLGFRDEGALLLASSAHLSSRLRLRAEYNRITAVGREALEARFGAGVSCSPDWTPDDDIPF